jgi:hypothetical protein
MVNRLFAALDKLMSMTHYTHIFNNRHHARSGSLGRGGGCAWSFSTWCFILGMVSLFILGLGSPCTPPQQANNFTQVTLETTYRPFSS